jgi:hypothetical protein
MSMDARPDNLSIQRTSEKEEEDLQRKPLPIPITPLVQRETSPDGEELQTSSLQPEHSAESVSAGPDIETTIQHARVGGQSLPETLRARMERAFGADFSGVRIHADAQADNLNRSLQARAFTTGHDLYFKRGEYNPASHSGQELIAHELTHVIQQGGGQPPQTSGNPVAPLQSTIKSSVAAGIQLTQAQLQMKRSYRVLEEQLAGKKDVAVLQKNGYHISIVDPQWTWTFTEFHVTFENNTEGGQARFFYDENADFKALDAKNKNYRDHPQNKKYRDDQGKSKGSMPTYETLRDLAHTHATDFVKEITVAQEAANKLAEEEKQRAEEAKKQAEEAKKKKITDTIAEAIKNNHTGFQLVTKNYSLAAQKDSVARSFQNQFQGSRATASLGDPYPKPAFVPTNRIKIDLLLKDFKTEGESAFTKLFNDQSLHSVITANLK